MKKNFILMCFCVLMVSLSACGNQKEDSAYSYKILSEPIASETINLSVEEESGEEYKADKEEYILPESDYSSIEVSFAAEQSPSPETESVSDDRTENSTPTEETQEQDYTGNDLYSTIIAQENEFYDIISNNPIDRDFVWEGGIASERRIGEAAEYRDLWNVEIGHTLAILKEYLTEEDYEMLQQAHESWTQYIGNTMCVEQNIFYVGMSYGVGSNDTYPLVMEAAAERTKEYAIELMALEYALTGTVEFVAGN